MNPHLTQRNITCLHGEREREIKELVQSKPGIEEGSSLPSLQSIRKEMRSCGIVLEAKPGLGDAI